MQCGMVTLNLCAAAKEQSSDVPTHYSTRRFCSSLICAVSSPKESCNSQATADAGALISAKCRIIPHDCFTPGW